MQNSEEDAIAKAARHVMAAEKHVTQQEILLELGGVEPRGYSKDAA